jgi:hypothetical protein
MNELDAGRAVRDPDARDDRAQNRTVLRAAEQKNASVRDFVFDGLA